MRIFLCVVVAMTTVMVAGSPPPRPGPNHHGDDAMAAPPPPPPPPPPSRREAQGRICVSGECTYPCVLAFSRQHQHDHPSKPLTTSSHGSEEKDICPKNMTCSFDKEGHPFCHIPGGHIPNSHCLTAAEYEPSFISIDELNGGESEECQAFDPKMICQNKKICCRTLHGHHCFYRSRVTSLKYDYVSLTGKSHQNL